MRLEAMTVGMLRRVIALYEQEAYASVEHEPFVLGGADTDPIASALSRFRDESLDTGDSVVRRYALRLGNPRYPFMKLVLQEHLVKDEFFFEVDTHDQMFDLSGTEERQFDRLKRYNLDVKERVETLWGKEQLPTSAHLKGLVQTRPAPRSPPNGCSILVVDNDADIASTLALLLQARGFDVTCLLDGRDAVELPDAGRYDLILMDNEMVHLNGFEACRVLKSREDTQGVPVIIATAGALTLRQLDTADGFLVKPFRMELLFSMIEHLLQRRDAL